MLSKPCCFSTSHCIHLKTAITLSSFPRKNQTISLSLRLMMMAAQVEIVDNGEIIDSLSPHTSGDYSSTILLREENHEYDVVKNCFLSGMGLHAAETTVVSVRKTSAQRITAKAKLAASNVFAEAMKRKNGGDANVRYGWYSGSKEEIERIVSYGFSSSEVEKDDRSHGVGVHFLHHTCSLAA